MSFNYQLWKMAYSAQVDLGARIKAWREENGWSQQRLADEAGTNDAAISRIENGQMVPQPQLARRLGEILNPTAPMDPVPNRHARLTDPLSSDQTVKSIAADTGLANLIVDLAYTLGGPFTDTTMTMLVANRTSSPVQRNVVARARGLLEETGQIVRLATKAPPDPRGRRLLQFVHVDASRRQQGEP